MSAVVDFIPAAGETVYSQDGRQGEYVIERDGAHIVMPMMRDGDDDYEPWTGEPQLWHEVYQKPPVPVVHEEVAAVTADLNDLYVKLGLAQQEINKIREERAEYSRDHAAVRARLKENEALRNIDAYLAGTITHFITGLNSIPKIETTEQALTRSDGYRKNLRLLGLFGDKDREVRWNITTYGDGSGGMDEVIPCLSLEEAEGRLLKHVAEYTVPCMQSGKLGSYYGTQVVELAARLGVPVPPEVIAKVKAERATRTVEQLARARIDLARYTESLRQAEAEARAAGVAVEGGAA